MNFKNVFFIGFLISLGWYIIWQLGYGDFGNINDFDKKSWILMTNVKFLTAISLYIAWRVTPGSK